MNSTIRIYEYTMRYYDANGVPLLMSMQVHAEARCFGRAMHQKLDQITTRTSCNQVSQPLDFASSARHEADQAADEDRKRGVHVHVLHEVEADHPDADEGIREGCVP